MGNIESAVTWMERIAADDRHGYDQDNRNGPDYDCSSFVGTALNQAGFNVSPSSTTRNLRSQLLNCGFKSIGVNESRKRGDIILKEGSHVITCVNANNIVHASINEKGTSSGGKTGDQTGTEICVKSFYTYPGGWEYHFRYGDGSAGGGSTGTWNTTGTATCTGDTVNYRQGPGTNYASLGKLNKGDIFEVDGQIQNGWVHMKFQGTIGWMLGQYVKDNVNPPAPIQEAGQPAYSEERVYYRAHVQNYGTLDAVRDGQTAGTIGKNIPMEAFWVDERIIRSRYGNGVKVYAKAHISDIGWKEIGYIEHDTIIGTQGQAKPLEAFQLTAEGFPSGVKIYYRCHVSDLGWLTWTEGGNISGTVGQAKSIQAIQIKIQ